MTDLTRSILAEDEVKKLKRYLDSQPKLIILTHANPDGDAIGSALGLYGGLKQAGFEVEVACIDPCPEEFEYLEHTDALKLDFNPADYQAVVFVDCGDKKLTRFEKAHPEILSDELVKINIDHHASNDSFGEINFVITDVASASMIV